MQTFLESVLDEIPDWESEAASYVFVLPSKRAGFFLKNRMAERVSRSIFSPEIRSIEEFVESVSGLEYASPLHLLLRLYEAYLDQELPEKESFSDFARWGQLLLQDFNEIDRYLIDARNLFGTLAALNEIRNWSPEGGTTPLMERRIAFWKQLYPIYREFRAKLDAEKLGYQGMVYREAIGKLPEYLRETGTKQYVFVGFNALNAAERRIIDHMLKNTSARIFWDADPHYVNNAVHDAGLFLRKHLEDWPVLGGRLQGMQSHFTQAKRIELIGLPKSVSQAKYCGDLVGAIRHSDPDRLNRTALVLGDESLLNPVLNALPEELPGVNITMSYPVHQSPLAQLFELLLEMRVDKGGSGWNTRQVLRLLSHPYLQGWFRTARFDAVRARNRLIRENRAYVGNSLLHSLDIPEPIPGLLFPEPRMDAGGHARALLDLTEALRPVYQASKDPLALEYLYHFYTLFNQLEQMIRAYPFITDLRALQLLFRSMLAEEKVDFEGQPLRGLQVMGMLESRNLDFDTVIISSVNEGVLPAGKSNSSFIPFEVKREFGLPTYKEKDAVYTYHFYRLLQRANTIHICYNTEPDVLEGGEPSRFINQLRTDPLLGPLVREKLVVPKVSATPETSLEIQKSPGLVERLAELAEKGLSPTSLARYVADPLLFYRRNVLGIPESDELEETVAANTFGTVLHQALEDLYKPYVGDVLVPQMLLDMKARARDAVTLSFSRHYLHDGTPKGRNLIALKVLQQHVELFLESESRLIRDHNVRILGVEQRIERLLPIEGLSQPVRLKGTVDRIEEVDGAIRVIDYKTGMVSPSELRISGWESLRTDPKRSKAFQVLCYALLHTGAEAGDFPALRAGIISFKNLGAGRQWFGFKPAPRAIEDALGPVQLATFRKELEALLLEIFNPGIPLAAAQR